MASPEESPHDEWSLQTVDLLPIEEGPEELGNYVLCYEIASGGMGTVYLAREQGPGGFTRPVAIKRIHPHLAKKRQFVDMFLDEARVAARITHPNVCSVYGFGQIAGTHYIAMEYLAGQPISSLAPRVAQNEELAGSRRWHALAARIIADACEGLHAAHELRDESGQMLNVVHRDVSTHNVFVTYDGAVKVLDFGIARARGRTYETRTGAVKGKLAYMSPEQARAEKTIDRRSDVWSLGVMLWELLALRRMFGRRSEIELLRAVAEEPIVPPSLVRPEVPPELDEIVMRALERDVAARYPTARAFGRELAAFVAKSGEATSLGDLAELLDSLFATDRAGKLEAVATAMQTDTGGRVVSRTDDPIADAPTESIALPPPSLDPETSSSVVRARRTPWLAIAAVASSALIAGVAIAIVAFLPDEDPVRAVREPPREVAIEPAPEPPPEVAIEPAPEPPPIVAPVEPPPIEAPEPPEEPAPRAQMGQVNVAATGGWADIYVRGRFVARTPRMIRLPAGTQVIELRPSGGPPRRVTVNVRPGRVTRVVVPLR